MAERLGGAWSKEDEHLGGSERSSRGMLKHFSHLLQSDAGKPFHKLRDARPVLEILEQRRHWDTGAAKYPYAPNAKRITLYR